MTPLCGQVGCAALTRALSRSARPPRRRQQSQGLLPPGTAFDLFRGTVQSARDEVEAYPSVADYEVRQARARALWPVYWAGVQGTAVARLPCS